MSSSKKENSISLIKFLNIYYGIDKINSNIKHNDIKLLFPHIKRTSYKITDKNIEKYYDGKIIYVYDITGNCIPYVAPKLNVNEHEKDEFIDLCFDNHECLFEENIDNLNLFELIKLKKRCIFYNKRKELHKVSKTITEKIDYRSKDYKRKKEKVKTKERREYNDQY